MKLDDIAKPPPPLDRQEVLKLLAKLSWTAKLEVSPSGVIDVVSPGKLDLNDFVKHNRFVVRFNNVKTTETIKLNNLISLEGGPKVIEGSIDIRSNFLTSLEHGPREVASMFVEAPNLDSLTGMPKKVTGMFLVRSKSLTSLKGLGDGSYHQLDFCGCEAVTLTDGLKGVKADYIGLPTSLQEVTEVPDRVESIGAPGAVRNVAKLLLIKGLREIIAKSSSSWTGAQVKRSSAVHKILELVLKQHASPKDRYFVAQEALIEAGFSDLV